jgi:hypothetical protein
MPFIFILLLYVLSGYTQPIFPGLTGQQLQDSLAANYKPQTVLSYADARDTLFSRILTVDDSLHCVYSDYTIWMDPTQDPNQWAYNNGIDTEHTWPQSKGAVNNARSDMHHLYPTRIQVNSARGSDPFSEIPDIDTDRWFRKEQILTTIPSSHIDEYSEKDDNAALFEPREDHKGNVARAMFYFYTMYEQEANAADPNFFQIQKDVLLEWHRYDPADSLEIVRTGLIAGYQDGCANPYVLDSSLVYRAYFAGSTGISEDDSPVIKQVILHQNYPNPFNPKTVISWQLAVDSRIHLSIYDLTGNKLFTLLDKYYAAGLHRIEFDASNLSSGVYFYRLDAGEEVQIKKMILIK